jgi:hypothetical protein
MSSHEIQLTGLELDTLIGIIGEMLDDNSGIDNQTRVVLDSIYAKVVQ